MRSGATSAAVASTRQVRVRPQGHRPLDPQVQGDVVGAVARGRPGAVHARPDRRPPTGRQGSARSPRRTTTRQPTAVRAASAQSRTAIPRAGRGGVGHRAVGHPRGEGRGDPGRRRGARPRGSCRRRARAARSAPAARPPRRRRRTRRRCAARGPSAQPRGGQRGQQRVGDVAQVGDADAGRPQPLQEAGRGAAEPGVGHAPVPSPSSARTSSGRPGTARTLDRSAALSRTGRTSAPQPVAQPDARGRGRPHRVAGGGHVQLGEHVLEVDRGDRVHQPPGQRGPDRGGQLGAVHAGQPVRHERLGAGLAGGQRAQPSPSRPEGSGSRAPRPAGAAAGVRARCHVLDIGSGRAPIDPSGAHFSSAAGHPRRKRSASSAVPRRSTAIAREHAMRRTAAVALTSGLARRRHRGVLPRRATPRRPQAPVRSCSWATTGAPPRGSTPAPIRPSARWHMIPGRRGDG